MKQFSPHGKLREFPQLNLSFLRRRESILLRAWIPAFAGMTLLVIFLIGVRPSHAHGGGEIKIAKEPIGPYKITVWLNPPQPQAGKTMHITVGVLGKNEAPVLDAAVMVEMIHQATGQIALTLPATTERSTNKLYYEADFPAPEIGSYEISLQLAKDDTIDQIAFATEVEPAKNTNWLGIGLVGIGVILVVFLFFSSRNVDLQIPNASA
ncbi:MAG: hypothetical protein GY803_29065 [Chloroflexi bacterium]|nr:hypothetical protein [Chloroflexota bacterium]